MKTSSNGLMELCTHEGIVLEPYKDSVGVWTIGIGHTRNAGGLNPDTFKGKLTVKECFDLLRKDIKKYETGVNRALQGTKIKQSQFDALVSFHYNTGGIGRASFMNHLRAGDMYKAANGMMNWRKPPEIIPRRTAEKELFISGQYSKRPIASIYPVKSNGSPDFRNPKRIDLRQHIRADNKPGEDVDRPTPPTPPKRKKTLFDFIASLFKRKSR